MKWLDQYKVEDMNEMDDDYGPATMVVLADSPDDAIHQACLAWSFTTDEIDAISEGEFRATRIPYESILRAAGEPELFDTSQYTSGSLAPFLPIDANIF